MFLKISSNERKVFVASRAVGTGWHPQMLQDLLTLSQPGLARVRQIMPTTLLLLPPPIFFFNLIQYDPTLNTFDPTCLKYTNY